MAYRYIVQRATEYKVRNNSTSGPDADGRQDLRGRYGKIGISAVTAALMCIRRGVKHRDQLPESPAAGSAERGERKTTATPAEGSARGKIDKIA